MAYNTLRGKVQFSDSTTGSIESIVDDWQDQTIAGGKTFSQKLTASTIVFSGDSTEMNTAPAVMGYSNPTPGGDSNQRVILSTGGGQISGEANLTFKNQSLTASYFSGSGAGLKGISLSAHKVSGQLDPSNLNYGNGLAADGGALVVTGGAGITVDGNGVSLDIAPMGGMGTDPTGPAGQVAVAPNAANAIGSLASADEILVADNDASNALKKASFTQVTSLLQSTLSFTGPGGSTGQVQYNQAGGTFAGSSALTFSNSSLTASYFSGSGIGLKDIDLAPHKVTGRVSGSNIFYGDGLTNFQERLSVLTASSGGLGFSPVGELYIKPSTADAIEVVESGDEFILTDAGAGGSTNKATMGQLHTFITGTVFASLNVSSAAGGGRGYISTPDSAPTDSNLGNGSITFYLDEGTNKLKVRVRYGNAALKTGEIALS